MIDELKEEIRSDEGCEYSIYKCTAGKSTFGIGHMIKLHDPEFGQPEGTPVPEDRVEAVFRQDVQGAIMDCHAVFGDFFNFPEEVQKIMANMMFQLGINRFRTFEKMISAVEDDNWSLAGDEMRNSLWNKQTHARSERLIARMKAL